MQRDSIERDPQLVAEVSAARAVHFRDLTSSDADRVASWFHPDAVFRNVAELYIGHDQIRDGFTAIFAAVAVESVVTSSDEWRVLLDGRTVLVNYVASVTLRMAGAPSVSTWDETMVWERTSTRWLMRLAVCNPRADAAQVWADRKR